MDTLNKFDPLPCSFGPAIKPAAKPTPAELREKELREFETMTDKVSLSDIHADVIRISMFGSVQVFDIDLSRHMNDLFNEICGIPPRAIVRSTPKQPDPNRQHALSQSDGNRLQGLQGLGGIFY